MGMTVWYDFSGGDVEMVTRFEGKEEAYQELLKKLKNLSLHRNPHDDIALDILSIEKELERVLAFAHGLGKAIIHDGECDE